MALQIVIDRTNAVIAFLKSINPAMLTTLNKYDLQMIMSIEDGDLDAFLGVAAPSVATAAGELSSFISWLQGDNPPGVDLSRFIKYRRQIIKTLDFGLQSQDLFNKFIVIRDRFIEIDKIRGKKMSQKIKKQKKEEIFGSFWKDNNLPVDFIGRALSLIKSLDEDAIAEFIKRLIKHKFDNTKFL